MDTTTRPAITRVNIYTDHDGTWCYAAWAGDEHDHNDVLVDAETEVEARAEVSALFPHATIARLAR